MNRKRTRPNWFRIILLCLLVLAGAYLDRYIVPYQQPLGVLTPTATRPPESYITEAEQYFNQGKLLKSIESYQQAIMVNPENSAIYIAMARVQVWAGQYADAQQSAENALLLNSDSSMAHATLAWALNFQEDYGNAKEEINKALTLDDRNALAHAYYVEILVDSGSIFDNFDKVKDESQIALALGPDLVETHRARGILLDATQNYQEAATEFQAAIKINDKLADIHLKLGLTYLNLGFSDQAISSFQDADALNPPDPWPDYYISRTYAGNGEWAKAMQFAEQSVKDSPEDARFHGNLGLMYYYNFYWQEAATELGYVVNGGIDKDGHKINKINLVPGSLRVAEYYYTYAQVLARLNRCGEALQITQEIRLRIPGDSVAIENADAVVSRCEQNLIETPILIPTSTESGSVSPAVPTSTP